MQDTTKIMTRKLVTVRECDSIRTAYQVMKEKQIRHLPVCDLMGTVVGILSDRDIHRAIEPSSFDTVQIDPEYLVRDFMSFPVESVHADAPVREVAKTLLDRKVSAVLVETQQRRIIGIITTDDLIQYLVDLLSSDPEAFAEPIHQHSDQLGYWAG